MRSLVCIHHPGCDKQPRQITDQSSLSRTAPWAGKGQAHRLTPTPTATTCSESRSIGRRRPPLRVVHRAQVFFDNAAQARGNADWRCRQAHSPAAPLELATAAGVGVRDCTWPRRPGAAGRPEPAAAGRRIGRCRRCRRQRSHGVMPSWCCRPGTLSGRWPPPPAPALEIARGHADLVLQAGRILQLQGAGLAAAGAAGTGDRWR